MKGCFKTIKKNIIRLKDKNWRQKHAYKNSKDLDYQTWCSGYHYCTTWWCRGVVVITTAQLHSSEPELRFCTCSNPALGVSEIRDGEDL